MLAEIILLLTEGRGQEKVFQKDPIRGFIRAKSLKDIFVRVWVTTLEKKRVCFKRTGVSC